MASFNKVILAGNLTRDPEMRYTPKGTAVARIGLAVQPQMEERDWRDEGRGDFCGRGCFRQNRGNHRPIPEKGPPHFDGRPARATKPGRTSRPTRKQSKLGVVLENFPISGFRRRSAARAAAPPKHRLRVRRQPLRLPQPKAARPRPPGRRRRSLLTGSSGDVSLSTLNS